MHAVVLTAAFHARRANVERTTDRTADAARPKPRGRECGQAPEHDAVRNAIATRQYAGEAPRRHADDEQPRPPP